MLLKILKNTDLNSKLLGNYGVCDYKGGRAGRSRCATKMDGDPPGFYFLGHLSLCGHTLGEEENIVVAPLTLHTHIAF